MRLYFDESGDYGFPEEGFACYVQAALICPERTLMEMEHFVSERKAAWSVNELHAAELARIGH